MQACCSNWKYRSRPALSNALTGFWPSFMYTETKIAQLNLRLWIIVHSFHQANPHVHQHAACCFSNPDRNVVAKTTCCWWTCGFAWWLWFPSKNHHWNSSFLCAEKKVLSLQSWSTPSRGWKAIVVTRSVFELHDDGCLTISEDPWAPSCTCLMYAQLWSMPASSLCTGSIRVIGCSSAREDPDCSRLQALHPPSSVAHTPKVERTSSSRLAIVPTGGVNDACQSFVPQKPPNKSFRAKSREKGAGTTHRTNLSLLSAVSSLTTIKPKEILNSLVWLSKRRFDYFTLETSWRVHMNVDIEFGPDPARWCRSWCWPLT